MSDASVDTTEAPEAVAATASGPNGAESPGEGAHVVIDVPEGDESKLAALRAKVRKVAAEFGSQYVLETDVPKVENYGDLLREEAAGWPSTLLIPYAGGMVPFHIRIASSPEIAGKLERAAEDYQRAIRASVEAMRQAKEEHGAKSDEYVAAVEQQQKAVEEATERLYGELWDCGAVAGWTEDENGVPFDRDQFMALCRRPDGAFLAGLRYRFRQLVRPKLEALVSEGEA